MYRLMSKLVAFLFVVGSATAFAPVPRGSPASISSFAPPSQTLYQPCALQRQRKSVAQVQTMGLFGLGAPEIGIILVAAAFLLGPDKLASLGKDAGRIAGELKEVPKEFQEGMKEGEAAAMATKKSIEAESASPEETKTD